MSGKEAQVYLVEAGGELRAAKVYKESNERSFHNRSSYAEGRKFRNTRDQRAMSKRSRHGRDRDEEHWKSAEADVIQKLYRAGVRVPKPYAFIEGVLIMECVTGPEGGPAPRLAECSLEPEDSQELFHQLIRDVCRMLCADIVHGDLSLFNVLLEEEGAVIIDFPQAINAAQNRNAKRILIRDVNNLTSELMQGVPQNQLRFAHEMWALYEQGELLPDSVLTGRHKLSRREIDAEMLLGQMMDVEEDEALASSDHQDRRPKRKKKGGGSQGSGGGNQETGDGDRSRRAKKEPAGPQVFVKGQAPPASAAVTAPPATAEGAPPKRRRRRRRGGGGQGSGSQGGGSQGGGNRGGGNRGGGNRG
ncbi:MAG: RIO kinase 1 [Bradymonadia bacterium]|jgi:RIO kinase 1